MTEKTPKTNSPHKGSAPAPENREERLGAALRANLQRRKEQARARAAREGREDKD